MSLSILFNKTPLEEYFLVINFILEIYFHLRNFLLKSCLSLNKNKHTHYLWKIKKIQRNNAERVVLAREVDYNNLEKIVNKTKDLIEIEYFPHGDVCISYSGICTMSNNFSYRDSNVGGCAHSCR